MSQKRAPTSQNPGNNPTFIERHANLQTNINIGGAVSAEEWAKLEELQPGFAERLMRMVEKEQDARIEIIKASQSNDKEITIKTLNRFRLGLFLGFFSVVVMVSFCGYLAYLGDTKSAAWTAAAVIVGLAGVFVFQKATQSKTVDPPKN